MIKSEKKKILKILLISKITIYGYVNFNLISSLLKLILDKLKNQKYSNVDNCFSSWWLDFY
jgi:hypothetical protein